MRFTAEQARTVALAAGLDDDTASSLHERTHGWPAGLRMALNVLRASPGAALAGRAALIDRQVFDFLATGASESLSSESSESLDSEL